MGLTGKSQREGPGALPDCAHPDVSSWAEHGMLCAPGSLWVPLPLAGAPPLQALSGLRAEGQHLRQASEGKALLPPLHGPGTFETKVGRPLLAPTSRALPAWSPEMGTDPPRCGPHREAWALSLLTVPFCAFCRGQKWLFPRLQGPHGCHPCPTEGRGNALYPCLLLPLPCSRTQGQQEAVPGSSHLSRRKRTKATRRATREMQWPR